MLQSSILVRGITAVADVRLDVLCKTCLNRVTDSHWVQDHVFYPLPVQSLLHPNSKTHD